MQLYKEPILKSVRLIGKQLALGNEKFPVWVPLPAMHRGETSAAITRAMSKSLGSKWKWCKGYKEITSPYPCFSENCYYLWKKTQMQRRKKSKFGFTTGKSKLSDYDEWRASSLCHGWGPYHIFLSLQSVKIFVLLQLINVGTTMNYNLVVLQKNCN